MAWDGDQGSMIVESFDGEELEWRMRREDHLALVSELSWGFRVAVRGRYVSCEKMKGELVVKRKGLQRKKALACCLAAGIQQEVHVVAQPDHPRSIGNLDLDTA